MRDEADLATDAAWEDFAARRRRTMERRAEKEAEEQQDLMRQALRVEGERNALVEVVKLLVERLGK